MGIEPWLLNTSTLPSEKNNCYTWNYPQSKEDDPCADPDPEKQKKKKIRKL